MISLTNRARIIVAVVVALVLACCTILFGIANMTRAGNPALALRFVPNDARALEAMLDEKLRTRPKRSEYGQLAAMAQAAVRRDATSASAIRSLGALEDAQGRPAQAHRLMVYADKLTRRDLATRLFFIEDAVAKNNVQEALRNYDIALRASDESRGLLFPIIASAVNDPELAQPIGRLFRQSPPWFRSFLDYSVSSGPPPVNLAAILGSLPDPLIIDVDARTGLVSRLVSDGEYQAAYRYFRSIVPAKDRAPLLRGEGFADYPQIPPFGWVYVQGVELGAEEEADVSRNSTQLRYFAKSGDGGAVASQLLVLSPGKYRLRSYAQNTSTDRLATPEWRVNCANQKERLLVALPLTRTDEDFIWSEAIFEVPAGCDGQWVRLRLRASDDPKGIEGYIRRVTVTKL